MLLTSSSALSTYLPSSGLPAPLSATLVDPTSSGSGVFGGEVVALRLNVDFSDAGYMPGLLAVALGDLVIHDYAALPEINGLTVRQFLDQANVTLGGASCRTTMPPQTFLRRSSTPRSVPSAYRILTAHSERNNMSASSRKTTLLSRLYRFPNR